MKKETIKELEIETVECLTEETIEKDNNCFLYLKLFILVIISIGLFIYGFNHTNKDLKMKLFDNTKYKVVNLDTIKEDKISNALNLKYIANESDLSSDNDNVNLIQETKDNLYMFNLKVLDYQGNCSIYYEEPCTFETYRAYDKEYINIDNKKDHNSGYDIDLKLPYITRGEMKGYETGDYILKNAKNYGFVNRYFDKKDREDRYSHFRYVGIENAKIMSILNISIKNYKDIFNNNITYYSKSQNVYFRKETVKNNKIKLPTNVKNYMIYKIENNKVIIMFEK